jgi:DNA-binding response OmpR family regulator
MNGRKIIILDESEEVHEKLGVFLEEKGFKVYHAFNGEEGIQNIFSVLPDCVITEILLPGKNGLEIIKECKVSPKVSHIPFILYTILYFKDEDIKKGINLEGRFYNVRVDAYFQKPTLFDLILEKIREFIGEQKPKEEKRGKILIIEDDLDTVFLLRKILEGDDYVVEYAQKGHEGIRKIDEMNPDLILLDYILPDTDGMEILSRVKEKHKDIPVIIMTAYGSEDLVVEILKRGADDYLAKPFPISREILLKIEENVRKRRKMKREETIFFNMMEMNDWITGKYFVIEDLQKKILSLEKDAEKLVRDKLDELRRKHMKMKENVTIIKGDLDVLLKNFEETLNDTRERFAYLKPDEEKFPENVRDLTGRIREGLQRIEVLIYKIKDKLSMLEE